MLEESQLKQFEEKGHLTVPAVFTAQEIEEAREDVQSWSEEFMRELNEEEKNWYLEDASDEEGPLRKLDLPVFQREVFRKLAQKKVLVKMVEQLIGDGVTIIFSQIFLKPPEKGGPKPIHQDNHYFGPDDTDAMVTAWIALDDATPENGCLYYGDGSHKENILDHVAPPDEPFNLQVPESVASRYAMTPAPVQLGGVSFHHGNTLHQSGNNESSRPRRALACHYLRNDARLATPALPYDSATFIKVT
ncbi:MAG: phytanoyl-CoA dioxygenase family protein [Opitutales bacterium]